MQNQKLYKFVTLSQDMTNGANEFGNFVQCRRFLATICPVAGFSGSKAKFWVFEALFDQALLKTPHSHFILTFRTSFLCFLNPYIP
jgi:hypothetical protein